MNFELVGAISAKNRTYLDQLLEDILSRLNEGPAFYPSNMSTNRSKKFLMAELIREKILHLTHQEVPHSVYVSIESITRDDDNLLVVHANIMVERSSQKKIIIGQNGELIKRIGTRARLELKPLLNEKLFLDLHVKVSKDWRKKNHVVDTIYSGDFE
jgi:GTP-binding protein Era